MTNKDSRRAWLAWILICFLVLAGCVQKQARFYQRDILAMDTYISCGIWAENQEQAELALDQVERVFIEMETLSNRFDAKSQVYQLNQKAGKGPVVVNPDLIEMVNIALQWTERTQGAFNILIGSAMDLWGVGAENPRVPEEEEIAAVLPLMDCSKIIVDVGNSTLFLSQAGMVMDLGGVAKGYAVDQAVLILQSMGIKDLVIDAGSNVYTLGRRGDDSPWKIGVQDPRHPEEVVALLEVSNAALASSGDYQRYFERAGILYHHILDPATGYPARGSTGTTVIMQSAVEADILSTALFVLGPEQGIALADNLTQVQAALIIGADGELYGNDSLSRFRLE